MPSDCKVPRPPAPSAAGRFGARPQYISASTKSLVIQVNGKTASVANVTADGFITVFVHAPVGSDTFVVTAYDQSNGKGRLLSTGSTVVDVPATGRTVQAYVSLGGVVAFVALSLSSAVATLGSPATVYLSVVAKDVDGNTIVSGFRALYNPFTLTSSDPARAKLSKTIITNLPDNTATGDSRIEAAYYRGAVSRFSFSA